MELHIAGQENLSPKEVKERLDILKQNPDTPKTETPRKPQRRSSPEKFIMTAKGLVRVNYNKHRPSGGRELTDDDFYLVSYQITGTGWTALLRSPIVYGMMWDVEHNKNGKSTTINVYKRVNDVKIGDTKK